MQSHTPLGYQIQNGRAEIQPESADLVREIFDSYLHGSSTGRIAKDLTQRGILNANQKPSWSHGSVVNILDNSRYIGDAFYPALIERNVFEQVQCRRKQRAEALGRTAQGKHSSNQSIWSSLLVCGECGQAYRKYTGKRRTIEWKCRHSVGQNHSLCDNRFLSEQQLEQAFVRTINQVMKHPVYLNQDFIKEPVFESSTERKLTLQIGELLAGQSCDAQEVKQLAFRRAAVQYQMIPMDDRAYQNEKIADVLKELPLQTECNMTLLEQTIRRIVVKKQTGLQFYLKNGRSITIPIGEGAYEWQ